MSEQKPLFAAIPARAMGDDRLSSLDIRALMAVAVHDRMRANGVGSYAGHPRLASLVTCHLKSLSRSLKHLAECGYIESRPNPLNRRTMIYNVVYNDFDHTYFEAGGAGIGNEAATVPSTGNETATYQVPAQRPKRPRYGDIGAGIGNEAVAVVAGIGNQLHKKAERSQEDGSGNIFSETEINPDESVKKFSEAAKWAHEAVPVGSVGAILGMVERKLKHGGMSLDDVEKWRGHIDLILEPKLDPDSVESRWARRLSAELDARAKKLVGGHGTA